MLVTRVMKPFLERLGYLDYARANVDAGALEAETVKYAIKVLQERYRGIQREGRR